MTSPLRELKTMEFCCSEKLTHVSNLVKALKPDDISLTRRLCGTSVLRFKVSFDRYLKVFDISQFEDNAVKLSDSDFEVLAEKARVNASGLNLHNLFR
jgi:hypothetical protein